MKKKLILATLAPIVAIVSVFLLFSERTEPIPEHSDLDPVEDDEEEAADDEFGDDLHGEPRLSEVLRDPAYQEPAAEPLVSISGRKQLHEGPFMAPRYAADGKHVLFTGDGFNGLWVASRDGSDVRQISDEYMAGWRPVTTSDGDLIYRTAQVNDEGVIVGFTIRRHDLESGEETVVYSGENEDIYPPWLSRDEDMIFIRRDGEVFAEPLRPGAEEVPLHERDEGFAYADGGQVFYHHVGIDESTPLSTDEQATGGEVASPDGSRVAYLSGNEDGILIVDLSTGEEVEVGEGSNASWSPDGDLLLYDVVSDDGHNILESDLFVVEADGENRQRLTFDSDRAFFNPSWSPEGDSFVAEDVNTGEIHVFEVDVNEQSETTQ